MEWEGGERQELVRLGGVVDGAKDNPHRAIELAGKVLRVRGRDGRNRPLLANVVQQAYEQRRGRSNIVLKARQLGITTWVAGQFFLRTITRPGTLTVQVAHTQEAAQAIFRIVHRFLRCLPASLCQGALKSAQVNARRIIFPGMDSEYRVETAGAPNAGRGLTITNLHCSEVARWPGDAEEILQGMRAALAPGGELVLESTPMGAAGCFWNEWRDAAKTGTVQHFFPWWMEAAYVGAAVAEDSLTEAEQRLVRDEGLSLKQIGYRRGLQEGFRGLARQEYAEDAQACFLASGDCIFDTGAIDSRMRELRPPPAEEAQGTLHLWLQPVPGRAYLVAVDPAGGGTEGDFTAVQVIDRATGLQCAELQAKLSPLEVAEQAALLARRYNEALLVIERNNHGAGVLAHLEGVCRYARLYETEGQAGWLTSAVTRPRMLAQLGAALVETPQIFSSARLLRECRSFVRHANGRTGAQAGEHDDCVMAMAMALAVREATLTATAGARR